MNKMFKLQFMALTLLTTGCQLSDVFYANTQRSDVFVQQYSDSRFDFLWVVDNSGSMGPHRQFVKDNMQSFLNILSSRKAVDFQMAVTTTDMMTDGGKLIQSASGLSVVKSVSSTNPAADFAGIIDGIKDSPTSWWEQGLESAYQAIQNSKSQFSRTGVPLIIILITDEDDYSCASNYWFGVEPENNPNVVLYNVERYINYFKSVKSAEQTQAMVFPIVGMKTGSCTVASYGVRYQEVQVGVGGVGTTGSICSGELTQSYQNIARVISDRGMVFKLTTPSSTAGIKLYVDGKLIPYSPDNYILDTTTNSIIFTGVVPKSGSVIEISYSQKVG